MDGNAVFVIGLLAIAALIAEWMHQNNWLP
jgi:hypothetical protein